MKELGPVSARGQGSAGERSSSSWTETGISQKLGSLENTGLVSVFHPQKRLEPQQEGGPAGRTRPGQESPGQPQDANTVLFTEGSPGQLGCPFRASPATSLSASRARGRYLREEPGAGRQPRRREEGRMCQPGSLLARTGKGLAGLPAEELPWSLAPALRQPRPSPAEDQGYRAHALPGSLLRACTTVSMAPGFAVTTTTGWPGAGQCGRLQARNRFSRGPRGQRIFEGLPPAGPTGQWGAHGAGGWEGTQGLAAASPCHALARQDHQDQGTATFGNARPWHARPLRHPHHLHWMS